MKTSKAQLGHLRSRRWWRTAGGNSGFVAGFGGAAAWALLSSTSLAQDPPSGTPAPADEPPPAAEQAPPQAVEQPPPPPAPEPAPPAPAELAPPAAQAAPAGPAELSDTAALDLAAVDSLEPAAAPEEAAEVVVTVDRRQKNLQDYSGTAAAFSESKLQAVGITNAVQLSQVVPGLTVGQNNAGAIIYIRGVGSDNGTELGDPAVAVHLDNVYLPRFRGVTSAFLDVERVEVNSGPQGTVRGRNATGGSINIISRKPVLGEYHSSAEATFGTFRQRAYQGMVNIPFGDTLALRVAASSTSIDPTWHNAGPIDHLPGAQDTNDYAAKGSIRFQPTPKLDIVLAADYTLQRGVGFIGANMIGLLTNRADVYNTPLNLTDDVLAPIDPESLDDPRRVFQRGRYPSAETEHWGTRLSATLDAGPVQFEVLGSYRFLDWRNFSGSNAGYFVDQTVLANQQWDSWAFAGQQNNDSKSWVGEFRVASPDDQQLVWSVGVFGFHEDQGAFLGQITADPGGFNEFNMPSTIGYSYAGYGDITFSIADDFRVMAGLRYSIEHKDRLGGIWMIGSDLPTNGLDLCARTNTMGQCVEFGLANQGIGRYGTEGFRYKGLDRQNYNVPGPEATTEERVNFFLDGIESFGARDQTAIALCNDPPAQSQLDNDGSVDIINPGRLIRDANGNFRCANGVRDTVPANFTNPRPQNGERDDQYLDWRLGVEFDATKENFLYATLSTGHKAGGFNDSIPNPDVTNEFITPDYGPETVYTLEVGSKNEFMERKLRLNASAFGYLYDGLQFQTIITVGQAPPLNPDGSIQINPATGQPFPDNRGGSAARQNARNNAMIMGLDVDAIYSLPFGLEADFHALFMSAKFPDETYVNDGRLGLGTAPAQVDIGGNWLPRVAPYTFSYSLSQLIFTEYGGFDWIIQAQTRGPQFFTPYNGDGTRFAKRGPGWGINPINGTPQPIEADDPTDPNDMFNQQYNVIAQNLERLDDRQGAYTFFNVGVGWRHPEGILSIRGFVNNVFDIAYATEIGSTSGNNTRFFNNPRMTGVRVRMDW
jgi:iron complex outermembrane recepter protein